jgi:hypothetical protein
MQTLVFNTATKQVQLFKGSVSDSEMIMELENVPTVKVIDSFYEVMQRDYEGKSKPVLRVPISGTNMVINS